MIAIVANLPALTAEDFLPNLKSTAHGYPLVMGGIERQVRQRCLGQAPA